MLAQQEKEKEGEAVDENADAKFAPYYGKGDEGVADDGP